MKNSTKKYPSGWVRTRNIYGFPYGWQSPAKTEQWAYELFLQKLPYCPYTQVFCFPWATLIDLLKQKQQDKALFYLNAITHSPPKVGIRRITICQHIYAKEIMPYLMKMGITDIYWSHKTKNIDVIQEMKIHPFPLYPVMHYKRGAPKDEKHLSEKKLLYSFIGSYQPGLYLSPVREWIFNLPKKVDVLISKRDGWHFESDVYREQILGLPPDPHKTLKKIEHEDEYIKIMQESIFCLCPSGSGPNSIRLWEAIRFGCIPVLVSDDLELPGSTIEKIVIRIPEKQIDVEGLDGYLRNLLEERQAITSILLKIKEVNTNFAFHAGAIPTIM